MTGNEPNDAGHSELHVSRRTPNLFDDADRERNARSSLAKKLAQESVELEKKDPADEAGAVEAFLEGVRVSPPDWAEIFPRERLDQLRARCLALTGTHLGSPGTMGDYDWLGRAAALDALGTKSLPVNDLHRSTDFCLSQARSILGNAGPEEQRNEKLKTGLPWILASIRLAKCLDSQPGTGSSMFPGDERKKTARDLWRLGGKLFESNKRKDAIEAYRVCELLDPVYSDAMFNRSLTFVMESRFLEAEVELYDLVAIEGWVGDAAYLLGMSWERQERYADALACYARGVALDKAKRAFTALENLIQMHRSDFVREFNQPSLRTQPPSTVFPAEVAEASDEMALASGEDLEVAPRGSTRKQKGTACTTCGEAASYRLVLLTRSLPRCKVHVGAQHVQLPVYGVVDLSSGTEVDDPKALRELGYSSLAPHERLQAYREGKSTAHPVSQGGSASKVS